MIHDDVFTINAQIELLSNYLKNIELRIKKIKDKINRTRNNIDLMKILEEELISLNKLRENILYSIQKLSERRKSVNLYVNKQLLTVNSNDMKTISLFIGNKMSSTKL